MTAWRGPGKISIEARNPLYFLARATCVTDLDHVEVEMGIDPDLSVTRSDHPKPGHRDPPADARTGHYVDVKVPY